MEERAKEIGNTSLEEGANTMRTVTVYRVDYINNVKIPIGEVVERRAKERGNNLTGLLLLARKKYARSPQEAFQIVLDGICLNFSCIPFLRTSP